MHEAIFEEFRQLDQGANRRHDGIGLGLAVCRGLVKLLRGDLVLDSTVGVGSIFTVRLPFSSPPVPEQEEQGVPIAVASAAH